MKNVDLETFYNRIKKSIKVASAFANNKNYASIIKSCRLKPLECFEMGFITKHPKLFTLWADEYGNSLDITSGEIIFNNSILPSKSKQTTDLFFGMSFEQHINKSIGGLFLGNGFPELIAFYGQDEYIRCVNVGGFGMSRISPLIFGINALTELINKHAIKHIIDIHNKLPASLATTYINCVVTKITSDTKIEDLFNDGK